MIIHAYNENNLYDDEIDIDVIEDRQTAIDTVEAWLSREEVLTYRVDGDNPFLFCGRCPVCRIKTLSTFYPLRAFVNTGEVIQVDICTACYNTMTS